MAIHLKGISPEVTYLFENPETGEMRDILGADLIHDGFTVALAARSGAIWFYQMRARDLAEKWRALDSACILLHGML
jgi:hypothetical protein